MWDRTPEGGILDISATCNEIQSTSHTTPLRRNGRLAIRNALVNMQTAVTRMDMDNLLAPIEQALGMLFEGARRNHEARP